MANLYGTSYAARYNTEPLTFYPKGDFNAHVKCLYETYALPSAVIAQNDLIYVGKLPAGAKIQNVVMLSPTMGGTGTFQVGTVADSDRYISSLDAGDGAAIGEMVDAVHAGQFEELTVETEIVIKCTEATTATSGTLKIAIYYVVD